MQFDYGNPVRGYSYEYYNFYQSLLQLGYEVTLFDYMTEYKTLGKAGMNRKLLEMTRQIKPTLALFSLYTDQFDPEMINRLREFTTTLCFFHDDTWRVEYSRFWARRFDFFTTPDLHGEKKYAEIGMSNAIHFPFGCNEKLYFKMDIPKKYDVSFVGSWHPYREWLINHLRKAGFSVAVAGYRWPDGIISHENMVRFFNESKINLNLSNSVSWNAKYLFSSWRAMAYYIRSPKRVEQLKARHFEINGCGAFQLSFYVEGLENYYEIGREVAVYTDPDDLLDKVEYYLKEDELRELIAQTGHRRTLAEHTFEHRFKQVFDRMGLTHG
ncbi:MAG: glycosyltransferase [Candidatus Manganitrophus sp. SA1]|nr:glycosyltransferase [Candidatus Manganitrophus morganii]